VRLVPPTIAHDTPSGGEKLVFELLTAAHGCDDWTVLHSFDITHHRRRLAGEIDFLVVVPGKGVLVVEVKGCHTLRRNAGLWYYGDDPQPDGRGPFKQASEAMHSLRARLVKQHHELAHVPFWSAACFPFIDFSESSEEWRPWQIVDRRAMGVRTLPELLAGVLEQARALLSERRVAWFRPQGVSRPPTSATASFAPCVPTSSSTRAPGRVSTASTRRSSATPKSSSRPSTPSPPTRA